MPPTAPPDGLLPSLPPLAATAVGLALLLVVAFVAQLVVRRYLLGLIERVTRRTRASWDQVLFRRRVFHRLAAAVPLIVVQTGLPLVPNVPPRLEDLLLRVAAALMTMVIVRTASAAIAAAGDLYETRPAARERPIKGFLQAFTLVIYLLGAIVAVALFLDRSPWLLISGLGVMASVLLLVFQDTLLSFVAGIQLTANRLIRVGDWIEVPQFGADGDVVDITLNSVLVQNFDKTITVIPAHTFLKNSFRNWRGMQESGGRRIMRRIDIDMSTVRFLTDAEIDRFRRYVLLRDYMEAKLDELARYNAEHAPDPGFIPNARRLTNLGTFRAYVSAYLRGHPGVAQDMTFLVRQLEPTPKGVPLQIYVFANTTAWAVYEGIQADIFEHLLATVPEFGLRVFQEPAGSDLASLAGRPASGAAPVEA